MQGSPPQLEFVRARVWSAKMMVSYKAGWQVKSTLEDLQDMDFIALLVHKAKHAQG